MGIAESMKELTRDILASTDRRVKAIEDLVADTQDTLREFSQKRKTMSAEQAASLSDYVAEISKNTRDILKEFQKNHQQMRTELTKDLTGFVHNLRKDVDDLLGKFKENRGQMSAELKSELKAFSANLTKDAKHIRASAQKLVGEYRADMQQARAAWQEMASALAAHHAGEDITEIEVGEGEIKKLRRRRGKKRTKKSE